MDFTFVTTTNGHVMSASGAKLMRAHVTKTNFARRRRRIAVEVWKCAQQEQESRKKPVADARGARELPLERAQVPSEQTSQEEHSSPSTRPRGVKARWSTVGCQIGPGQSSKPTSSPTSLTVTRPADPHLSILYLYHEFAPLLFPGGNEEPLLPNETSWAELLMSDPALLEATMAIGVRVRPTFQQGGKPTRAEAHLANAVSLVNRRISSAPSAVPDSLLAAVFTLAFAELFLQNEAAWGIHIDGLARMIRLRHAQGEDSIPSWFSDLILYDGFRISTPPMRHRYEQLFTALRSGEYSPEYIDVSAVTDEMAALRRALNAHHAHTMSPRFVTNEIEARVSRLQDAAEQAAADHRSFLRTLGRAILVFLQLSWPQDSEPSAAALAVDLRRSLEDSRLKICTAVNVSTWSFFVGAVASKPGSGHRKWFLLRLQRSMSASTFVAWGDIVSLWEHAFMPYDKLLQEFEILWEECVAGEK